MFLFIDKLVNAKQIEIIDSNIRIQLDEIVISPSKLITRILPDSLLRRRFNFISYDILRDE